MDARHRLAMQMQMVGRANYEGCVDVDSDEDAEGPPRESGDRLLPSEEAPAPKKKPTAVKAHPPKHSTPQGPRLRRLGPVAEDDVESEAEEAVAAKARRWAFGPAAPVAQGLWPTAAPSAHVAQKAPAADGCAKRARGQTRGGAVAEPVAGPVAEPEAGPSPPPGRVTVPAQLARGGRPLEASADHDRRAAKAAPKVRAKNPAITEEVRKASECARSSAYHKTIKDTNGDKALAALAGKRAKEAFFNERGIEWVCQVRGPSKKTRPPPAESTGLAAPHAEAASAVAADPAAAESPAAGAAVPAKAKGAPAAKRCVTPPAGPPPKKPRTPAQLEHAKALKAVCAELRVSGVGGGVAKAAQVLRARQADPK
jgi:hypothetical protein